MILNPENFDFLGSQSSTNKNGCIFHKTCSILNCKTYKPYRHGITQDRQYKKLHDPGFLAFLRILLLLDKGMNIQ